jgi:hypothetical protein
MGLLVHPKSVEVLHNVCMPGGTDRNARKRAEADHESRATSLKPPVIAVGSVIV